MDASDQAGLQMYRSRTVPHLQRLPAPSQELVSARGRIQLGEDLAEVPTIVTCFFTLRTGESYGWNPAKVLTTVAHYNYLLHHLKNWCS